VQNLIDRVYGSNEIVATALTTILATNKLCEYFQVTSGYLFYFAANTSEIYPEHLRSLEWSGV
jgi:hypothetical protein